MEEVVEVATGAEAEAVASVALEEEAQAEGEQVVVGNKEHKFI